MGAIVISLVARYWLPILIMGVLAGIVILVCLTWISSRLFRDYQFHRFILMWGALTGTLPSGLALLRVVDPQFETPASRDYIYAAGIVFPLAIPMLISVNFPAYAYRDGNPTLYWVCAGIYLAYLLLAIVLYRVLKGKGAFRKPARLWLPPE
jgi:ESS family glutamate:Na+ symporter